MTLEEAVRERLAVIEERLARGKETESGYPIPDYLWQRWIGQSNALQNVLIAADLDTEEDRKRWR